MRVFTQRTELSIDLPALLRATRLYFEATLEVQAQSPGSAGRGDRVELALHSQRFGYSGSFVVRARPVTEHDLADAELAERLGRAAGMASLARRCPTLWDVEAQGADDACARLNLCAILASVALGPVLPDDGATLYGVRGAMERVERLLHSS